MKSAFNYLLPLVVIWGVATGSLTAAERQEYSKTIKREFDITANGTTSIVNKYGKVDVKTWNRNRVKIDVTITVKAASESAAQRVFERIDVSFSNTSATVKAITNIEPREKSFWSWASNDKSDYSINYEVFLPATNNLELDHRYGDVYVAALDGKVTATLKYANVKLEGVSDGSRVNFAYGNGSIVRAKNLYTDVSYGKLLIKEAENLEINSKYTQVSVERANDVRAITKYDDYKLTTVRNFSNTGKYDNISISSANNVEVGSKYTQVNVKRLTGRLSLNLEYGGAEANLARSFTEANLVGSYTDFKLGVEPGADFTMDAATTYAGIAYPSAMTVTYELEKGSSHEVKGHRGRQGAPVIKARLSYGGLKIREE